MAQRKQRKGKTPEKRPLFPKEVKPASFREFVMIQARRMGPFMAVGIIISAWSMWSLGLAAVVQVLVGYFLVPWAVMLYLWWRFNMAVGLLAAVAIFASNQFLLTIVTG